MDPPGSKHFHLVRDDDDHDDDNNNYDDNCNHESDDEADQHHIAEDVEEEVMKLPPHSYDPLVPDVPIRATAAVDDEDTPDDALMRSSEEAATQKYAAYLRGGGPQMTPKTSIESTRVLVQIPSRTTTTTGSTTTASTTLNHPTAHATTAFEATTPIIAIAIPNDAPVFVSPSQERQLPNVPPTEQAPPREPAQKYTMMVERLVSELGYPTGLAQRLVTCVQTQFVKHYWLVDNSGSMLTNDCFRMIQKDILDVGAANSKNLYDIVKCSRWNELQSALISHVDLARILEVPTTFRLLNGQHGVQEFTINQVPNDIETAKSIIRNSQPDGVTLLSNHIMEICHRIEADKDALLEKGQKAVVVIATDAIPSDLYGESCDEAKETFFHALRQLQLLPVWIVIRLCTSDRKAIQYYRKLDKKLELPIECVSDFINENKEVRKWNPWLHYTQQIHQCREMGFHHRVFDLLDERAFTKDDLHLFLTVLFGTEAFDANISPNIHSNWKEFLTYLQTRVLNQCAKHYSPSTKKMEDIIDVKGLAWAHGIYGSMRNSINNLEN